MSEASRLLYDRYWQRKEKLKQVPGFSVVGWRAGSALCVIEQIYFDAVKNKKSILDIGAGDLRIKNKMQSAGFSGEYDTLDVGDAYTYTYNHIDKVQRKYEAIICLDVIEHMPLEEGVVLMQKMLERLEVGGVLVLQTPNGRCIRHPSGWDMTHVHCYNLPDLWSWFAAQGHKVWGYRVVFEDDGSFLKVVYRILGRFIVTRLLGADYADNIALIIEKQIV